eukprot:16445689-Heterocapsa_arctica.AAC.1
MDVTDWSRGFPGIALVTWQGQSWRALDYGDELELDAGICDLLLLPAQTIETKQCLLKITAAALLYAQDGDPPAYAQVVETARALRAEHWWAANEASSALGRTSAEPSPEEKELR